MMRVLVVDDERLARQELRRLLADHPQVEIVGEADSVADAIAAVAALAPDLVLMNVQLPDGSGYELLDAVGHPPEIIFTTGHGPGLPESLTKPIDAKRLAAALDMAAVRLGMGRRMAPRKLFLRDGERCWLVRVSDIQLFESEGAHTRVYLADGAPLIAQALPEIEKKLDPQQFFRASRRHIVNLADVRRIEHASDGGLTLDVAGMPVAVKDAAHHAN